MNSNYYTIIHIYYDIDLFINNACYYNSIIYKYF